MRELLAPLEPVEAPVQARRQQRSLNRRLGSRNQLRVVALDEHDVLPFCRTIGATEGRCSIDASAFSSFRIQLDRSAGTIGSDPVDALEVEKTRQRLVGRGGGYEIIHDSPGLEVGVYVLVAPEPD